MEFFQQKCRTMKNSLFKKIFAILVIGFLIYYIYQKNHSVKDTIGTFAFLFSFLFSLLFSYPLLKIVNDKNSKISFIQVAMFPLALLIIFNVLVFLFKGLLYLEISLSINIFCFALFYTSIKFSNK